jgi:hypothetical protein
MLLDESTVSRKTPLDGRLEVSPGTSRRLAALGDELTLVCDGREGTARLHDMACTCAKASDGAHVHHFVESPLLTVLVPGTVVRVELDERATAVILRTR